MGLVRRETRSAPGGCPSAPLAATPHSGIRVERRETKGERREEGNCHPHLACQPLTATGAAAAACSAASPIRGANGAAAIHKPAQR